MLSGWGTLRFFYESRLLSGWKSAIKSPISWIMSVGLLLALASPTRAQQPPAQSAKPATTGPDSPKPLSPKQLEEALRLLLRADSAGRASRRTGSESQGLVIDLTISKLGRNFYDFFYGSFEAPGSLELPDPSPARQPLPLRPRRRQ